MSAGSAYLERPLRPLHVAERQVNLKILRALARRFSDAAESLAVESAAARDTDAWARFALACDNTRAQARALSWAIDQIEGAP